jgi:hypothetical protein
MPYHGKPIADHEGEGSEEHKVMRSLVDKKGKDTTYCESDKVEGPDSQDATNIERA